MMANITVTDQGITKEPNHNTEPMAHPVIHPVRGHCSTTVS